MLIFVDFIVLKVGINLLISAICWFFVSSSNMQYKTHASVIFYMLATISYYQITENSLFLYKKKEAKVYELTSSV